MEASSSLERLSSRDQSWGKVARSRLESRSHCSNHNSINEIKCSGDGFGRLHVIRKI
jgi:hypothetical protein